MGDINHEITEVKTFVIKLSGLEAGIYTCAVESYYGRFIFEKENSISLLYDMYYDNKTKAYVFDYVEEAYGIRRSKREEIYKNLIETMTALIKDNECDLVWIQLDLAEYQKLGREVSSRELFKEIV